MNKTNSKKKFTFSIIDFAIIFVVIALVIGIFARYDIVKRLFSKTSLTEAKISFIAEKIDDEEVKAFADNTVFYVEDEEFGILGSEVKVESALIFTENESGVLVSYEDDTLKDISGTFRCKVLKTDNGFLLNGNRFIAAGSVFVIKSNGVAVSITVMAVSEVK